MASSEVQEGAMIEWARAMHTSRHELLQNLDGSKTDPDRMCQMSHLAACVDALCPASVNKFLPSSHCNVTNFDLLNLVYGLIKILVQTSKHLMQRMLASSGTV